ncbi:hypothetical protein [Euzebya sp.]|uniref:hypothetical protein n=1 Tax=Euzebya sp. TaxID=1971409 RepID=UPI003510E1D3
MRGLDVGLTLQTYRVWKAVCHGLGLEWDRLSTSVSDPRSIWAWSEHEVVVERFHPSILRRLAERALQAGQPTGSGEAWTAAGGTEGHWLELDDFLRTLRAHREIDECALMVTGGSRSQPGRDPSEQ